MFLKDTKLLFKTPHLFLPVKYSLALNKILSFDVLPTQEPALMNTTVERFTVRLIPLQTLVTEPRRGMNLCCRKSLNCWSC